MKNYDEDRRSLESVVQEFTLAGQTFQAKPVMAGEALSDLLDIQSEAAGGVPRQKLYDSLVSIIRRTLKPECREAWDALLEQELDVPISLNLLMRIADDLVETTTARPTQQPSPSGTTGGSTSTKSTDGSDSQEESASQVSIPVQPST